MVPKVYHKVLPRRGIEKIIDSTSLNVAICIIAPYGCGKTLAVISWLRGRKAVWIDLDDSDNCEENILSRNAAAVAAYDDEQAGSSERILVIDNFGFIRDVGLLRLIKDFISERLGYWRIIVISRAELHPVFNDLLLKGRICLITLKDLSFNEEEISDFFVMNGCEVPTINIKRLRSEIEGWPAALNVVLTVFRGSDIGYREAARSYVKGFFETEIWNGLDNKIRDFLLKTSILKTLTPASCHAVTGIGATLPILNWLFLNGLFIAKLDERDTYRYHSVFLDFLHVKLAASDIDEKELNMKAAWWLYENNEPEQAFPYFFKSGDFYGINQILKILNPSVLGVEKFLDNFGCITELNISDLQPYPVIVARMALIHYMKGNVDKMQELYDTFLEWTDPGILLISPEEYAEYIWEAGWLCYLNPAEEVRNNEKHIEWTNYREYVPHLKDLHRGRAAIIRPPSVLRGIRDYSTITDIIEAHLSNAVETGQSSVHEEVSVWEMYIILAEYSYEIENYSKSNEIVRRIMTLVENGQMTDLYFVCTVLLVKLLRALNKPKEIDSLTDRLEAMIISRKQQYMLPNVHAFQLRNRLADGKPGLTDIFMKENSKCAEKPYYYLLYRHITLVRGLMSTGDYNEALVILGNLDILCHRYRRIMDLIELNILKSIALYGLGDDDGACRHISEALNSAKIYGYIRIFADEAKDIWPVLELVRKHMTDKYTKNVILSCKKALIRSGEKLPIKKRSRAELTKTEVKILKSLQIGMSYEEISLDSSIKISTVKSHIHSIYSKLEVDNKVSAIMTATEQGIITQN